MTRTRADADSQAEEASEAREAPASLIPPIARVGKYDLLGRLAVGGMAEIFLARESAGGAARRVVLKFIRPDVGTEAQFEEMFLTEARIAMRLAHPNICHVYEFNTEESRYYLAMEYVEGVTLAELLARATEQKRSVSLAIVTSIFARVAEALHHAHTARDERDRPLNIVHRDVTPHNIMVSWTGVVKLLDFGVAKVKLKADSTRSGALKGKFGYMSPEQIAGRPVDPRSDVFALGVGLYEAITGKRLYKRESEFATMRAIVEEPPPSIRAVRADVPQALDAIVRKALAKSPEERWATAGDMQEALEAHLSTTRSLASSRVVARFAQSLFEAEIAEGPRLDRRRDVTGAFVIPSLRPAALEVPVTPAQLEPEPAPSRLADTLRDRTTWVIAGAAIGLLAIVGLVAALATESDEARPELPQATAPAEPEPPPEPAPPEPEVEAPAAIADPVAAEPEPTPAIGDPDTTLAEAAVSEGHEVTEEADVPPEAEPAEPVRRPITKRRPAGASQMQGRPVFVRDPGF